MKNVAVLGCTGSIGTQTLDVIRNNADKLKVVSLVAFSNAEKLQQQVKEFKPGYFALISRSGESCLIEAVQHCDVAVVATKGITALNCILYCLDNGIDVALANKEALVCAGQIVASRIGKSRLIPVDSEHSAISQCISGGKHISKLLLTASGGPFYQMDKESLHGVTPQMALKHPTWNMGQKITIDSATMFNKALEVIEAKWLFGVDTKDIQIVVHRQSVVHSMVEFCDGSVLGQFANPDMRLPIQRALLGEVDNAYSTVDFANLLHLTFEQCDYERFPCAKLGYEIMQYPPLCCTVMNCANDVCVDAFLQGKITFDSFYGYIMDAVKHFAPNLSNCELSLENIKKVDDDTRKFVTKSIFGD